MNILKGLQIKKTKCLLIINYVLRSMLNIDDL